MLTWLRRYLVALFVVMIAAGGWLAAVEWQALRQIDRVLRDGQPVTALIEGAQSVERKSLLSYAVDLAWRDKDGALQRAKQVPISSEFAEQIITDGQLVIPTVDIRYLSGEGANIIAVATQDAERQRSRTQALGLFGLILALAGLVGTIVFGFNWLRRFNRSAAT